VQVKHGLTQDVAFVDELSKKPEAGIHWLPVKTLLLPVGQLLQVVELEQVAQVYWHI
jgi:hypothetical protein